MAKSNIVKETPLMKQYKIIKAKYPGALLLFRIGDFYETFGEDAIKASKVLEIVLTKRANGAASEIELAGFPHHALDNYLPKLVKAGFRVAICDQLEDPKSVKGIVKRGVTELVTPGLSLNSEILEQKKNNYLAAVHFSSDMNGISLLDISTGDFFVAVGDGSYLEKIVQSFQPAEILFSKRDGALFESHFGSQFNQLAIDDWVFAYDHGYEKLIKHFHTNNLKGYGIADMNPGIIAAGAILYYLEVTEHSDTAHINNISRIEEDKYMWLDKFSIRNLEILQPNQSDGCAFIDVMDKVSTPMGGRMLRKWLVLPLKEKTIIQSRLDTVEQFLQHEALLEDLVGFFSSIGDLERLVSKVATGRINPREMLQLLRGLSNCKSVKNELVSIGQSEFTDYADRLNNCEVLVGKIDSTLQQNAPMLLNQGNVIADGVDNELDELRDISSSGKNFLKELKEKESERTGINSLKIAYNKVFGYYLEVSNTHRDKVPSEWIRKQTLVNAERYITEELKTYEDKILNAEERIASIEFRIYQDLVNQTGEYISLIQQNAKVIATLDCLCNFALLAKRNNYTKPVIASSKELVIKEGRHPVIEQSLAAGERYIPNDVFLDDQSQQIIIITGPNMSGKSALLRQTAMIVLMAQVGSFVPAGYAKVGIVDKIFTRVGASDNLSAGESTFMVEMTETASILNNLSDRSLVIMDEIGRGTSTYDGISIARSLVEYMHNHPRFKAKTLFATHYHELNELTKELPRVKNFNVAVKELDNKVVFLRKLTKGGSKHSFGIHVAQMAGMPNQVVIRANEILHHLEKEKLPEKERKKLEEIPSKQFQLSLFDTDPKFEEVLKILNGTDINTISPVEALLKMNKIKDVLKGAN